MNKGQVKQAEQSEMTFEQFAAKRGCGTASRPTASHIRSTKNMSNIALHRAQKQHLDTLYEWEAKRNALQAEYDSLKISPPSRIQRLRQVADGHPDLSSTQAARRLLNRHICTEVVVEVETTEEVESMAEQVKVHVVPFKDRWWQVGAFGSHGCAIGWWSKDRWGAATPGNVKYISRFRSEEAAETAATLGRKCLHKKLKEEERD